MNGRRASTLPTVQLNGFCSFWSLMKQYDQCETPWGNPFWSLLNPVSHALKLLQYFSFFKNKIQKDSFWWLGIPATMWHAPPSNPAMASARYPHNVKKKNNTMSRNAVNWVLYFSYSILAKNSGIQHIREKLIFFKYPLNLRSTNQSLKFYIRQVDENFYLSLICL